MCRSRSGVSEKNDRSVGVRAYSQSRGEYLVGDLCPPKKGRNQAERASACQHAHVDHPPTQDTELGKQEPSHNSSPGHALSQKKKKERQDPEESRASALSLCVGQDHQHHVRACSYGHPGGLCSYGRRASHGWPCRPHVPVFHQATRALQAGQVFRCVYSMHRAAGAGPSAAGVRKRACKRSFGAIPASPQQHQSQQQEDSGEEGNETEDKDGSVASSPVSPQGGQQQQNEDAGSKPEACTTDISRHAIVLCACSPYFASSLSGKWR